MHSCTIQGSILETMLLTETVWLLSVSLDIKHLEALKIF